MAGHGPPPDPSRARSADPSRGEWTPAPGIGWQHGDIPRPPAKLLKASRDAWAVWMRAWFAAHWTPDDLPGLRQVVRLYDQVERGDFRLAGEMRRSMDWYGITRKGQQDRRWTPPMRYVGPEAQEPEEPAPSPYGHLRSIS